MASPPFKCPACERALYDRRRKKCGYCGSPIPEALRFSKKMLSDLERGKFAEKDQLNLRRSDYGDFYL